MALAASGGPEGACGVPASHVSARPGSFCSSCLMIATSHSASSSLPSPHFFCFLFFEFLSFISLLVVHQSLFLRFPSFSFYPPVTFLQFLSFTSLPLVQFMITSPSFRLSLHFISFSVQYNHATVTPPQVHILQFTSLSFLPSVPFLHFSSSSSVYNNHTPLPSPPVQFLPQFTSPSFLPSVPFLHFTSSRSV